MGEFYGNDVVVDIDDVALLRYVAAEYNPEDVFHDRELADWAESNGFKKEND